MTTIPHLIKRFKQFLISQKQRSPNTVNSYILDVSQFFKVTDSSSPDQITPSTVDSYLLHLQNEQLSNRTIYRKITALDQFWAFLIESHAASVNPWQTLKRPKINQSLPVVLEAPVVIELLNNYPTTTHEMIRNKAILELLFASGIRVAELVALSINDLNLDRHECRVVGKGDKERVALFGARAASAICNYIQSVRTAWKGPKDSSLFIGKNGKGLTTRTIQRIVKSANQYHSSPIQITPHACRHTCASLMMANGAGIRDVQEFLGHSSITTTERYTHIPTHALRKRFKNVMDGNIAESV